MAAISVTVMQNTAFASGAKLPNVSANNSTNATDGTVVTTKIPEKTSGSGSGNTGTGSAPPLSDKYSFLDPGHEVPATLLSRAINYYETHLNVIANKRVIGVIDFKQHNSKERFYIIDLNTGHVDKYLVAHGKNSDPDYDGNATIFSNTSGSEASSVGFYLTAETYEGNHGYSLKLDGLSNTNSNARSRSIVMHPADYVAPGSKIGRSWGCPAVEPRYSVQIIDQLKGGALLYASNVY
ncbi:MAG: murein L,D-transpeptidase catalytic domain family protein [Bacteriovorax sp.]|nr:murein L,D-transpeptidase catalytic domain family protein [Bacteriovorax sp.]